MILRDASPADVVRAAIAAHVSRDWATLVSLADPGSIAEWIARSIEANTRVPTLEELLEPWGGRASRKGMQKVVDMLARGAQIFVDTLPLNFVGVDTLDELRALEPDEVLLRFFQAEERAFRMTAAAYRDAGLQLPDRCHRVIRPFRIVREELQKDGTVRVVFLEEGKDELNDRVCWSLRRQSDGAWRILVGFGFVLPLGEITFFGDDEVVSAYLERQLRRQE